MTWMKTKKYMEGSRNFMYKVFVDTNFLLDFLIEEREQSSAAKKVIELIVEDKLSGYICVGSLLDIFYIIRNQKTESERKNIIESFLEVFKIVDSDYDTLQFGLYSPLGDLTEGVEYACAKKVEADYILTGNIKFREYDLEIKRVSVVEFVEMIKKNEMRTT